MCDYGSLDYWDKRYEKEEFAYDWYMSYGDIREYLLKDALEGMPPKENIKVLIVGCGTSDVGINMVSDGFGNITCIDYSEVAIRKMSEKHKQTKGLTYKVGDVRALDFQTNTFDLIIDKGTLDSILCGENGVENSNRMTDEIYRVLKPNGKLVEITYGSPETRVHYLSNAPWTIDYSPFCQRYMYVAKKGSTASNNN